MNSLGLLLVLAALAVHCYSSGEVMASCEDMKPQHTGQTPQTAPVPFTVSTDNTTYKLGQMVTVELRATTSIPFRGFLLQAREVGGQSPVGSFIVTEAHSQYLTCNKKLNSAVSHTSNSKKTSIQVRWQPKESAIMKPIQFHASFVQDFRTFWVNITSAPLTFAGNSTEGSTNTNTTPSRLGSTSATRTSTTEGDQPVTTAINISREDCGVTKVCFSEPSTCDPAVSADCYFMSARKLPLSDVAMSYEITGPSDGYISFGFSDDQTMGNDDIYICVIGSDGLVQLQHAFSTGRRAPLILPLGNVSDVVASVQGEVISCSFTSMNPVSTQRTTGLNTTYHIMFAHGPSANGQIQFHTATFISAEKIDISRPQLVTRGGRPQIIKAHGTLMLIAWMTLGSVGMMVAGYRKGFANGKKLLGKDVWFVVHAAVMSLTLVTTIIAFILPFAHRRGWSGGAHPVLGCLVMILSSIQTILALLRCGPQHPWRFLFNWSHALNGIVVKVLSVAGIFTGLKLIDSTQNQWLMKVMGGYVGWEALFHILLIVNLRWNVKRKDTSESKEVPADILILLFLLGNFALLVSLLVGIGNS